LEHNISFVNSVHGSTAAKVLVEPDVVEIVEVRFLEARKSVVRMQEDGAVVEVDGPRPQNERVRAQQQRAHTHRPHVAGDVFDGVSVGGRDGQRRLPLVVLLVETSIKPFVVQRPNGK